MVTSNIDTTNTNTAIPAIQSLPGGDSRATVYDECLRKGVSRRDFVKFCTVMTAAMGLKSTAVAQVVKALESKPRLPIIWLHLQECTCCSESFIRISHPIVATLLFDHVSLDYTETLMAPSGKQAEQSMEDTMKKYAGEYILMIEGSVPLKDEAFCCIGGRSAHQIVTEAARGAKAVIAWGNCAASGCVPAARRRPARGGRQHR
jgi:hydrogenase small subunit